jgi:hypothetical protein
MVHVVVPTGSAGLVQIPGAGNEMLAVYVAAPHTTVNENVPVHVELTDCIVPRPHTNFSIVSVWVPVCGCDVVVVVDVEVEVIVVVEDGLLMIATEVTPVGAIVIDLVDPVPVINAPAVCNVKVGAPHEVTDDVIEVSVTVQFVVPAGSAGLTQLKVDGSVKVTVAE